MKGSDFFMSTSIGLFFLLGFGITSLVILAIIIFIIYFAVKKSNNKQTVYNPPAETVTPQQEEIRKSLGEILREMRSGHGMTQEFVAENLGVSRQAVSKWENGTSEPSTSNLIAIAKLYEIPPEELLKKLV
ncbi:MAG: helix-turn-helix transcriptional regulator [Oscillospiraceae bacterium]|nr:helix-turn-helix transcriptional regulator [Oscillospiraceae bacterium]